MGILQKRLLLIFGMALLAWFCPALVSPAALPDGILAMAQTSTLQTTLQQADRLLYTGQYEQALSLYQQTLTSDWSRADRSVADKIYVQRQTARALLLLERYEQAIPLLTAAIEARQQLGESGIEGDWSNLGLAYLQTGNWAQAETALQQAIQGWEAIRDSPGTADLDRVTLFEQQAYTYSLLQRLYVAQGRLETALVFAEQSRAQSLVEQLAQQANGSRAPLAPLDLEAMKQIARQEQATLVSYAILSDGRRILGNEIETETDLLTWVITPSGQVTFHAQPLQPVWRQFTERMENLTPLESLVQSSRAALGVSNRGFGDFSWVTSQGQRPTQRPDWDATSLKFLYELLIEPIESDLPDAPEAKVIFVPQRALFLVPFAALRDRNGTYLIENHTIGITPSIQALALTQRSHPLRLDGPALVVGNPVTMPTLPNGSGQPLPTLPGAEQEAVAIAALLGTEPWVAQAATETHIRALLADKAILHFATHGLLDFDAALTEFGLPTTGVIPNAVDSGVYVTPGAVIVGDNVRVGGVAAEQALARERVVRVKMPGVLALAADAQADGWLTAEDIAGLDLSADLVVLSACNTGRGRITGEGVLGLSRAFMLAGVPSIVVSLWQVPDAPTAELMTEFYQQLQRHPDQAQALRAAMLSIKARYPDPQNWAAFVLIGQMD